MMITMIRSAGSRLAIWAALFGMLTCLPTLSTAASTPLAVVATTPAMGALVRSIGGEHVEVTVLGPADRDLHRLQARPSMMRALRDADLLVSVGAELEVGWLPAAVRGAGNPRLTAGDGLFEAAAQVPLLGAGAPADRSLGDVHPSGNPHFHLDPQRFVQAGRALAARLTQLAPHESAAFAAGAETLAATVAERMPAWQRLAARSRPVLQYHADADYLLDRFQIDSLGYIEPLPGVPPRASHLAGLVTALQARQGVIVRAAYQPSQPTRRLRSQLGWPVLVLNPEPATDAGLAGYLALIEHWLGALAESDRGRR